MAGTACVELLQWALPRMGLRWSGYRRVRRQVCRRIGRRLVELGLGHPEAYRVYLGEHPEEWERLREICRITISRFLRERGVFRHLGGRVWPKLEAEARRRGRGSLRVWSAGCASGEEPYSLILVHLHGAMRREAALGLEVVATDVDPHLLARGRAAVYGRGSLREVPGEWLGASFEARGRRFRVRQPLRAMVEFCLGEFPAELPEGPFDLIACRYLAFTYFDDDRQREAAKVLAACLRPGGVLLVGRKEQVPSGVGLEPLGPALCRRTGLLTGGGAGSSE